MTSAHLKLVALLKLLYHKTDASHRLTATELVHLMRKDGFPVERRSVYRYIEAFRGGGIEVEKTGAGYYIENRTLRPEEARLIMIAARGCALIEPNAAQALENRLLNLLSDYQCADLRCMPRPGVYKPTKGRQYALAEKVLQAVRNKRQLSFEQARWGLDKRNRPERTYTRIIVDPFGIIAHQGAFELICKIEGSDEPSALKLADLREARVEATLCREWHDFDVDSYARERAHMRCGPLTNMALNCKQNIIGDIADRFGEGVRITRHNGGWIRVSLCAAADSDFIGWVLRHGSSIEVAGPPELRARVREILLTAVSRYSN